MSKIYHILGADIPQHNQTLLRFLQQNILPQTPAKTHIFYLVGSAVDSEFSSLNLHLFHSKIAIARALITQSQRDPNATFILHGQFNVWIWLALFCGKLPACRLAWHVWGADLYESATSWKFKLFYPIRRIVQKKIARVWATRGDLKYLWQHIRPQTLQDSLLYFPTKLFSPNPASLVPSKYNTKKFTILVGNSGDPSNQHIRALTQLFQQLGQTIHLIIPMGYPAHNERYIQQVEQHAKRLFLAENVQILRHRLHFTDYQSILSACDLGYFYFERQQGIGTICLLTQHNIPVALHTNNPFNVDMQAEKIPFLTVDRLSFAQIHATQHALTQLDKTKITFFPPNYLNGWLKVMNE